VPAVPTDRPAHNVAVLLAGGVGERMGGHTPKQLIELGGRTLLEHALRVFHDHELVDEILVLMVPGHLEAVRRIVTTGDYTKVTAVLEGATTRSGTTMRALSHLSEAHGEAAVNVLLHDAVRPLVDRRIVSDCLAALASEGAVDVAIPTADTIVEVTEDDWLVRVPPRATLRRSQTPQGFRLSVLLRAYALAEQDPDFEATDDCSVVLRYTPEVPIRVVAGDERNVKVTRPVDLVVAEALMRSAAQEAPPGEPRS